MSRDGPEKQTIIARLKAKSAQETKDLEGEIQKQHAQLAANLMQSSTAALKQIETSITGEMSRIESEVRTRKARLAAEIREIETEPGKMVWGTAALSALIAALIAMLPWGVMTWAGINAAQSAGSYFERARMTRAEETRINALESVEIITIENEPILMLPANVTQIFQCGTDKTPCIMLEE